MKNFVNDAVKNLCDYIKIDTSHPSPNYHNVFELFSNMASEDGFECKKIDLASGCSVLVILQRGLDSTLPALALNHHMDVVAAQDLDTGKHDSFSGVFENEIVYGRGTQDMKGVGVVHYQALRAIKKLHGLSQRTICLILVPDEEIGGFSGVGSLVQSPEFKKLNIGYVLDEGIASGDETKLLIKVTERKVLQLKIDCIGQAAHSSRLMAKNPVHSLVKFLSAITEFQHQQQINIGQQAPGNCLSMNVTYLNGGFVRGEAISINSIPASCCVIIDVRVPPSILLKEVKRFFDDFSKRYSDIKITFLAESFDIDYKPYSDSYFYNVLKTSIIGCGLCVEDCFAEEASDLRFYLQSGIEGFGLSPFTIKENIHGLDECLRVRDLEIGISVFYEFLKKFCL